MLLDPFCNLWKVFVLLPYVVLFAEVDEEDDGFGGQEEERIDYFDLEQFVSDSAAKAASKYGAICFGVSDWTFYQDSSSEGSKSWDYRDLISGSSGKG